MGAGCRVEGHKGEKKWDNCNSIINKIYFKKIEEALTIVAQLAGVLSHNQKVAGSIPSRGTYIGCRFDPRSGFV